MTWTISVRDLATALGAPWVLLPIPGVFLARLSPSFPRLLREPVHGVASLAIVGTVPVALLAFLLAQADNVIPPGYALDLTRLIYRLQDWADRQWWLKPPYVTPVVVITGIVSYYTRRPDIIKGLSGVLGITGKVSLALYVLSMFTLVAPGPVELKLDEAAAATNSRLKAELDLQHTARSEYLAKKAMHVLLTDPDGKPRQDMREVIEDAALLAQRLSCAPGSETSVKCLALYQGARRTFDRGFAKESKIATPANPDQPGQKASWRMLPALEQAVADARTATDEFSKKTEVLTETLSAEAGTLTDLLPGGPIIKAIAGEFIGAGVRCLSTWIVPLLSSDDRPSDERIVENVMPRLSTAVGRVAAAIRAAVAQHGPWVLLRGLDATPAELAAAQRAAESASPRSEDLLGSNSDADELDALAARLRRLPGFVERNRLPRSSVDSIIEERTKPPRAEERP